MKAKPSLISIENLFIILTFEASLTRSWTLKNLPEKIESFWCSFNSVFDAVIYAKWKFNMMNFYLSLERRPRRCIHEKIHGNNSFCYSKARNLNWTIMVWRLWAMRMSFLFVHFHIIQKKFGIISRHWNRD